MKKRCLRCNGIVEADRKRSHFCQKCFDKMLKEKIEGKDNEK